ncbi:MAG TPA: hypothetical protein VKA38_11560 [Draconibacterium sp.]|nr:hypothetical protein [Draconibacterium sp.]
MAKYELGDEENACKDFSRTSELGFSILKIAEEQRYAEIWDSSNK